jgi:hypothetical protein
MDLQFARARAPDHRMSPRHLVQRIDRVQNSTNDLWRGVWRVLFDVVEDLLQVDKSLASQYHSIRGRHGCPSLPEILLAKFGGSVGPFDHVTALSFGFGGIQLIEFFLG